MSAPEKALADEISEMQRRADQFCSIHAWLRDRYRWRANLLDYSVIALSTYIAAMGLIEPKYGLKLSFGSDPQFWIGCIALVVFFLTVVQFKNDWKSRSEDHAKSCEEYARVKSDCRALRKSGVNITNPMHERVRAQYDRAQELGTHIPDRDFLRGKAHHLRKVFVSKYLDTHPGAYPLLVLLKLFLRDNLNFKLLPQDEAQKEASA